MRKVIVCQDKNYGASKASATKNTALNGVDLAEGAVGIYGISDTSANNKDKMALITNGGSDAAGLVPDAAFDGKSVFVAVGTAGGYQFSHALEPAGKVTYESQAYVAPVAQVVTVPLTLAGTIAKNDESQVRITDQENLDQGGSIKSEHINSNVYTVVGETAYSLAIKHDADINARVAQRWMSSKVTAAEVGTPFGATSTATVTKGSTAVTTSGLHAVTALDWIKLDGVLYQAAAVPTTSSITLDRAYTGESAVLANAATADLGAAVTEVGLLLTSLVQGRNFGVSVDGVIIDSVITITAPGSVGHGAGNLVKDLENLALGYKGSTAGKTDATVPIDSLKAVETQTYDLYVFINQKVRQEGTGATAKYAHKLYDELIVAFPATPSNDGQTDFEAVLAEVLYGAANLGGI